MEPISTWENSDLPVLEAILSLQETRNPGQPITLDEVEDVTGFERGAVSRSIGRLAQEHVQAKNTSAMGVGVTDWVIQDTTPRGLRAAGVWPIEDDAARALIRALDEEIEEVPEGSPKSNKLKALRESAQNVGENTLAAVLAGAMKYGFGF